MPQPDQGLETDPSPGWLLWGVGYSAWPAPHRISNLLKALHNRRITRLIDIRLNPCASNLEPSSPYGPKPWNLQAGHAGLASLAENAGLAYEWIVELGNPQRQDPHMTILQAHLADTPGKWPVHRGLARLESRLREANGSVAILCTCKQAASCHRTAIARALSSRAFQNSLAFCDVWSGARLF